MEEATNEAMRLQVDIPNDLKTRLKLQSVRDGITMSEVVEKALNEYLNKVEKLATSKGK